MQVKFEAKAEKEFLALTKSAQIQILKYLKKIENLENPRDFGKALSGNLKNYWRYRVGDCHSERSEESQNIESLKDSRIRDISAFATQKPQYDNKLCHIEVFMPEESKPLHCHSEPCLQGEESLKDSNKVFWGGIAFATDALSKELLVLATRAFLPFYGLGGGS
ncbi:type II toxin-antitoxin system RelE family toxin [Helicobacter himalayensis]|uniref:type II toxin-antitoxin system RelE family toxin n=1 Tax=Helicobacter himalayensis TaxID=1591088 RepID=UPI003D6DF047